LGGYQACEPGPDAGQADSASWALPDAISRARSATGRLPEPFEPLNLPVNGARAANWLNPSGPRAWSGAAFSAVRAPATERR